jgi:hypothetical protein
MYTRFWREMPRFIQLGSQTMTVRPDLPPQFNNNPPKDRLVFAEPLGSEIYVATARNVDAYLGFGFQNMHATEASRYQDGHELFRALYPTLSKQPDSALYIESTPNGQVGNGAWFHEQCMDASERKTTEYGETRLVFIPWHEMAISFAIPFRDPEKKRRFGLSLTQTERDLLARFPAISLEQFAWRRMILAGPPFNRDEDLFDQEYPTDLATAFLLSGTSVFSRKTIKRLMANTREPIWEGDIYWGESDEKNRFESAHAAVRKPQFLTKGQALDEGRRSNVNERTYNNLRVFRWPVVGERIFITADIGGGEPESRDGDFSVGGVFVQNEFSRDELIMTWFGHINRIEFGELLSALAWAVCYRVGSSVPMPELVPEWTGPGTATCTYIDKKSLYPKLYRYEQPGVHGLPPGKHVGFESNAKTVPTAVGFMLRLVERDLIDIPDAQVVTEMSSYRQTDQFGDEGSYGGAAGRHDDAVAMLRMGAYMLRIRRPMLQGESDIEEVTMESDETLPSWDPFSPEQTPERLEIEEKDDDEELAETLFWHRD